MPRKLKNLKHWNHILAPVYFLVSREKVIFCEIVLTFVADRLQPHKNMQECHQDLKNPMKKNSSAKRCVMT